MPTIREAVESLEERLFVGRERDLETFARWLEQPAGPAPEILNVHGPGGVGKSALLAAFRRMATRAGRRVVLLDGRALEVAPEAFLRAVAAGPGSRGAVATAASAMARVNRSKPLVLVDTFEELEELSRWLQEEFLPNLDTEVRVVIAGRFALGPGWSEWQKIIRSMPLRGLRPAEVREYLARRGIEDIVLVQQIQAATGGLPLAVSLAADMVQQLGVRRFEAAPEWRLAVRSLVERLLADVRDPDLREVLEACSVVRQFDEPTLAATLHRRDISMAFDKLCRLSVVRPSEHGLMLHDDLRRMLAGDLRWRKPDRFRELRLAALEHYRARARTAPPAERHWLVAERLYLWGNEVVQSILFREDEPGLVYVEPGRPEDGPDLLRIWSEWLERILPTQQAMDYSEFTPEQDRDWLARLVEHPALRLRVARDHEGRAIGFDTALPIHTGSVPLLQAHPLFAKLLRAYFGPARLAGLPDRAEDTPYHYLLQAAYTDVHPEATEAALLRDLVGLLTGGGVFLTTTSAPSRKRLIEAIGFRWVEGAREWVWDREHPADGYVLDLSQVGVEAWIEAVVSGRPPQRALDPGRVEEELRQILANWDSDDVVGKSRLRELCPATDPDADDVRALVREGLDRARADADEDREIALRAVQLGYLDRGLSHERAAERLRVSRSTFYRLLRRGTQSLARALAGL